MNPDRSFARRAFAALLMMGGVCCWSASATTAPRVSAGAGESAAGFEPALGGAVLGRSAYVAEVLRANPNIEAARQALRRARARVAESGTFDDPMLDVGVAPLSIFSSEVRFGFQVTLSQRLPWFGKRDLERGAARAESDAAQGDLDTVQRDLALSAVSLYDKYYTVVRSGEITRHHVMLMRAMQDSALSTFEAGRGAAQDSLQAEAELAKMEQDAAMLDSERDVLVAELNELLHRAPGTPLPPPVRELPRSPLRDGELGVLESTALAERSEIRSARARARAEVLRAERAERESYPDVTVSGGYSSMWDMFQHRIMVGVALNLPLQLERRSAAVDEAKAARAEIERQIDGLNDRVRTELYTARRRLRESDQILSLYEQRLLPAVRQQLDAARAGFVTSQNPFTVVMEAEKNLRAVELQYELARAECDLRQAQLERALGRIPGTGQAGRAP